MARFLITALIPALFLRCGFDVPVVLPDRPVIVMTFDDGDLSIYETAYKKMREYDTTWTATHFLTASWPSGGRFVTMEQLKIMEQGGWETGGHGFTHENLSSVPLDSARSQIAASYTWLDTNGLSTGSYAYAYSNYNADIQAVAARYFRNIRSSHDFKYLDGVNRLELGCFDVIDTHGADDIVARIEEAGLIGSPLVVLCIHAIRPDTVTNPPPYYWCKESAFLGLLDYLRDQDLRVCSVKDAMGILFD